MTTVLPVIGRDIRSERTRHGIESDSRVGPRDREEAGTQGGEDSNLSVAGEKDPGAVLDLIGPGIHAPDAWCLWPRERSA